MPEFSQEDFYDVDTSSEEVSEVGGRRNVLLIGGGVLGVVVLLFGVFLTRSFLEQRGASDLMHVLENAEDAIDQVSNGCVDDACEQSARVEVARAYAEAAVCEGLNESFFVSCVSLVAYDLMDEKICKALDGDDRRACEDAVLLILALDEVDLNVCDDIFDEEIRESCESQVIGTAAIDGQCEALGIRDERCLTEERVRDVISRNDVAGCYGFGTEDEVYCLLMLDLADDDGDGLSVVDEYHLGTSDLMADTDEDGLTDFEEEVMHGTDPLDPDMDGDGFLDGDEVRGGYDVLS